MEATTQRIVTPKKLAGGTGWGVLVGPGGNAGETVTVQTRRGKTWDAVLKEEVSYGIWSTGDTEPDLWSTRERLENRMNQRDDWAASREVKRADALAASDIREEKSGIPFGQPILVGHHSERRHRKILERADRKMDEAHTHSQMVQRHESAAANIEAQLDRSIYQDDTDAAEKLLERIAEREAQRDRMKAINTYARKHKTLEGLDLTDRENKDLAASKWGGHDPDTRGYPGYALTNLGGNIRRDRERLENIEMARSKLLAQPIYPC